MLMKPLLPADDAAFHTSKILSTESILAPDWRLARVGHRRIKLNILMLILPSCKVGWFNWELNWISFFKWRF